MDYESLVDFLQKKMRLSHIYQPLLIRSLIEAGGSATIRQLAHSFLSQDESQLIFYEKKIKEMPLRILLKHNVVSRDGELISINVKTLSYEQKAELKMICERRLQEYVKKRGLGIWDYRLLDSKSIPDSLRYRVLKESDGRCALCGTTNKERPLDVDHIKPRSKGGRAEYENLQVLCSKCNRSKGNRDDVDFRGLAENAADPNCAFCSASMKTRIIEELDSVFAVQDKFPVTKGHSLIITKRHTPDFFSMSSDERKDAEELLKIQKSRLTKADASISGFNVGANCGESAGQTIHHAHIHLIPRRDGDTKNPKGGVRGVVPDKQCYT